MPKGPIARNNKIMEMTLPKSIQVGVSDVVFRIKDDDGLIGELQVSKGALVWFPKGAQKGYRVGWAKFGKFMEENCGKKCEKR